MNPLLTNVNFDPECFVKYIQRAIALREDLKAQIQLIGAPREFTDLSSFQPADSLEGLGIKDIRLGPTLPAFISPNVFKLLSQKYNLKAITTPDEDLAACLG